MTRGSDPVEGLLAWPCGGIAWKRPSIILACLSLHLGLAASAHAESFSDTGTIPNYTVATTGIDSFNVAGGQGGAGDASTPGTHRL